MLEFQRSIFCAMESAMEEQTISSAAEKRLAVVTGANKGIGLEICRQLASNGIKVILTARDVKRGLEAVANLKGYGHSDVVFCQLDVTDSSSIASLRKFITTQFGKLDILVNNAGVGGVQVDADGLRDLLLREGKLEGEKALMMNQVTKQTLEKAEECLEVNYYGCRRVTEALLPLLQQSNSARIVNVSGKVGQLKLITHERANEWLGDLDHLSEERIDEVVKWFIRDYKEDQLESNGWPKVFSAYKLSKAALNAYTRLLANRFPSFCINSACPGFVKTDINYHAGILAVEEGAKGPVMLALLPQGGPSGLFFDQMEVSTFH